MFSYYGSKSKIIKKYPKPTENTIVESFAGSARYALEYPENDIILIDKYKVITEIWKYLIQATEQDILSLPQLQKGDRVPEYLSKPEQYLMGFICNSGVDRPRKTFTKWAHDKGELEKHKNRIIKFLPKIRHWKVIEGSYKDSPNIKATWFIDPPYQKMGHYYIHSNKDIDYQELGEWCKSREGQVIVCENAGATWLEFQPLVELYGQKKKSIEVIWYKES